jgi:hypothetical protein
MSSREISRSQPERPCRDDPQRHQTDFAMREKIEAMHYVVVAEMIFLEIKAY